jgi:hypothetical protein
MIARDVFVGTVGVGFGIMLISAAWSNAAWYFRLRTPSWLTARFGRRVARWIVAALGVTIGLVGIFILWQGFFVRPAEAASGRGRQSAVAGIKWGILPTPLVLAGEPIARG